MELPTPNRDAHPSSVTKASSLPGALGAALLFGLLAWVGIELIPYGSRIATVWLANGVLLAILMTKSQREYFLFLALAYAANVVINLRHGDTEAVAFFLAACNSIEILYALLLMRSHSPDAWAKIEQPQTLIKFVIYVCLLSPGVSAAVAAVGFSYLTGADVSSIFGLWFMAHAMGLMIVTPTALVLMRANRRRLLPSDNRLQFAVALTIVIGVALVVFWQPRYSLTFMVFPALTLITFLGGFASAALGVLVVSVLAVGYTAMGMGPFMLIPDLSPRERVLLLQTFLIVVVIMIFPLAAVLGERRRMEFMLKETAATDALTGLPNRLRFNETITREWMSARRSQLPLSVAMIDVDSFKGYNDRYGHVGGDECLANVGSILAETVHRPSDLVARYGGEEFVLVLPDTNLSGALNIAEAIHRGLAQARIVHEGSALGFVTVSIGISTVVPGVGGGPADLIVAADRALYAAKNAGRATTETAICETPDADVNENVVPLMSKS